MDVIVYKNSEGGLTVVIPTGEIPFDQVLAKDVPAGATDVKVMKREDLPQDRYFRNAWGISGPAVVVDMVKARVIQMDKIRIDRDAKLQALDIDWMKATGQKKNSEADQIEAKRQVLRDLPQTFDLSGAETPDQLKALWPEELK